MRDTDTIHALASGALPAGVAVVRVSGPLVPQLLNWIGQSLPPRRAVLATIRDGKGAPLDEVLAIHFPAPRSFTGEDVLELHCHGGRAVVRAVSEQLTSLGSRPAEPGEFTMRAHASGRIDLIEAERLADLIEAETEAQRRFAASDRGQRLSTLYEGWREELLHARALIEASLDFADEEDAPSEVGPDVDAILTRLRAAIAAHLATRHHREIVARGLRVVIAGPPNAGKSSLLNALVKREAAIVTPIPGTTRDIVEAALEIGGHRIVLLDTAGLREANDPVEAIGVARARARIADADAVLWLDPSDANASDDMPGEVLAHPNVLRLASRSDLAKAARPHDLAISTVAGTGMSALTAMLAGLAARAAPPPGVETTMNERHERHLSRTLTHLEGATGPAERVAEEVRLATMELGRITGATGIEDVYGAIFSRFCMGK